jgi:glycosyltransferase involved in cell wall biosynthesis
MNQLDVSVIIPVLDEEEHIRNVIQKLVEQDWPGTIEIVIVDGNSTDRTVEIIRDMQAVLPARRFIRLCANPTRHIPVSLNIACANASHEIIVRTDGHTYIPPDYVSEMVGSLRDIGFQGIVGGRFEVQPGEATRIGQAIAISGSHPLGVGNAAYRTLKDGTDGLLDVDTVPFGAFTKSLWREIGGYDEVLLFDEDYDYNYRIRRGGYRIVLNPNIRLKYFSRKSLPLLWLQYYRYGYWANRFCLKHRVVPSARRCVPGGFVLALLLSAIVDLELLLALAVLYLLPVLAVSFAEGMLKRGNLALALCLVSVFPVLHLSYGIGSLASVLGWRFSPRSPPSMTPCRSRSGSARRSPRPSCRRR